MKKCNRCHVTKPLSDFPKDDAPRCNPCWEYEYAYHRDPKNQARRSANRLLRVTKSPRAVMNVTLAHGLRRKPTENPATIEDLMQKWRKQKGLCALTGLKMTWGQGKVLPTSISIDRIDPEKGYSADNLRLICHAVNAFRGRMSDAQMLEMARAIVAKADATSPTWKPYLIHSEAA